MLICMKPSIKQIANLHAKIGHALSLRGLSYAEIAKISNVDQSQVSRICRGEFKTFSNNVVQVCRALDVRVPRLLHERAADPEWEKAQASMHRIWTKAPGGATVIARVLDAIADLQDSAQNGASSRAPKSQSDS